MRARITHAALLRALEDIYDLECSWVENEFFTDDRLAISKDKARRMLKAIVKRVRGEAIVRSTANAL